jgi:putative flippase GtrA
MDESWHNLGRNVTGDVAGDHNILEPHQRISTKVFSSVNDFRSDSTGEQSGKSLTNVAPRRARFTQIVRYLVVGGLNTAFGYGSFAILNYLITGHIPYPYMVANVLANVVSITFAFVGYKYFVFRTKGNVLREYFRTYVVYGTSMLVGLALLPMLVFALGSVVHPVSLVPYVAQAICTVLVVFVSFFAHKKFSFRA